MPNGDRKFQDQSGKTLIAVMLTAGLMASALAYMGQSKLQAMKAAIQFSNAHWKSALLRSVSARAVADLKQILKTSPTCNLNQLLVSASTTAVWRSLRPNHYPKEWFQFRLVDEDGQELPDFVAPESDPGVWITNTTAGGMALPAGKYMVHVRMDICKKMVSRTYRSSPSSDQPTNPAEAARWTNHRNSVALQCVGSPCNETPQSSPAVDGLGGPWAPACPAGELQRISSSQVFDINAERSIFTVYFDASLLTNLAFSEPTSENAIDSEEQIGPVSPPATSTNPFESSGAETMRATGSNHWVAGCGSNCRTLSLAYQVRDTLKNLDPCSDIAAYAVGGVPSSNPNFTTNPAQPISRLWPTTTQPPASCMPPQPVLVAADRAPYLRLDSDCLTGYIQQSLTTWANNQRAGGIGEQYSFKSVIEHYIGETGALGGVGSARHKLLVWVSDGFNMGTVPSGADGVASNDILRLTRSHVYLDQPCGAGSPSTGYLDYQNSGSFFAGKLIAVGDLVYSAPAAGPGTSASPFIPQGVIDSRTGACVNITYNPNDPASAPPEQYQAFLQKPVQVTRATQAGQPMTVSKLFQSGFTPTSLLAQQRSAELSPLSISPAKLLLFPLSITDLDESNLGFAATGSTNSRRMYQLQYNMTHGYTETLASHLYLMPRISSQKFDDGVETLGINQVTTGP